MENKIEREALDFMNVESFSQLPIIRPVKEKPIRLFGKEFGGGGGGDSTSTMMTTINMSESIDSNPFHDELQTNTKASQIDMTVEINRKYECHYCFRSFPTSQALGGHQNAHKKERQNAKQSHIQSSIVHDQSSIYRIMNRHRLGEIAGATIRTPHHHHSTWTNVNNITPRFYGNGHNVNVTSPINNGSPLAFWQIPPAVHHNNSSSTSNNLVFSNDDLIRTSPMVKISTNCESNFVYEPKGEVEDHVSLDLHL